MSLFLFVNGNLVHDESVVDGAHKPVTFASRKEGAAFADALCERTKAAFEERGRRGAPERSAYVVASEAPPVAEPS